jgi:hypothetical protein
MHLYCGSFAFTCRFSFTGERTDETGAVNQT